MPPSEELTRDIMPTSKRTAPILLISLLIATTLFSSNFTSADDSQVVLSVDNEHMDVLLGISTSFSFLLENYDTVWNQTVIISVSLSGPADLPTYNLSESTIIVLADFSEEFTLSVDCSSNCSIGVTIYAAISGIDNNGTGNDTNTVTVSITPVDEYAVSSSVADANYDIVIQNVALERYFSIENTGWADDSYVVTLDSNSTMDAAYIIEGDDDADGDIILNITGLQDSLADHIARFNITFHPSHQARPGTYSFGIVVESSSGAFSSTEVGFYIPPPNYVIESLIFRPNEAALRSQEVTAAATVNNLGGNVDKNGNFATDVDVWFIINDLTFSVQYLDALFYNGSTVFDFYNGPLEVTAQFTAVDYGSNNITVRIDEFPFDDYVDTVESNEYDNSMVKHFWIVKAPSAQTPSFFLSLFYLCIAVFVGASISSYLRENSNQ